MIELISVNKPNNFDRLIDFIHDQWFDLSTISFNRRTSTVEIPFVKELFDEGEVLEGSVIKKVKIPIVNCILKIFEVEEIKVLDTEQVGLYDMTWIEYNPDQKFIQITTGIPLDLKIFIQEIEIKIYKDKVPIKYKHMRVLDLIKNKNYHIPMK